MQRQVTDYTGQVFGQFTVLRTDAEKSSSKRHFVVARCSCGIIKSVGLQGLKTGAIKTCNCGKKTHGLKHGMGRIGAKRTGVYHSWNCMIQRCTNPKEPHFHYYGGRGIKVCEDWLIFENFFADMGDRPEGTSLDRIDVNGDYCKSNCQWLPIGLQSNNTRRTKRVTWDGRTQTIKEWAQETGVTHRMIYSRLVRQGWDIPRALGKT